MDATLTLEPGKRIVVPGRCADEVVGAYDAFLATLALLQLNIEFGSGYVSLEQETPSYYIIDIYRNDVSTYCVMLHVGPTLRLVGAEMLEADIHEDPFTGEVMHEAASSTILVAGSAAEVPQFFRDLIARL